MSLLFGAVFQAASSFILDDTNEMKAREEFLYQVTQNPGLERYGARQDLWLVAPLAEAAELLIRKDDALRKQQLATWCWPELVNYSRTDGRTFEGIKKRTTKAAASLRRMEQTNRIIATSGAQPLPTDRRDLVRYGQISIIALAGYQSDFQATIYSVIADELFDLRLRGEESLPVLLLLEEAHTFAPAQAKTTAEQRAITTTKQIAQEGRKFGVGLALISQRPSRLDETTLSQCNSYIIMKMSNPADQNYVRRVIETLGEDETRMLPNLDIGEALISGQLINFPVLVRIKEPESKGEREEEDAFQVLEGARQGLTNSTRR